MDELDHYDEMINRAFYEEVDRYCHRCDLLLHKCSCAEHDMFLRDRWDAAMPENGAERMSEEDEGKWQCANCNRRSSSGTVPCVCGSFRVVLTSVLEDLAAQQERRGQESF